MDLAKYRALLDEAQDKIVVLDDDGVCQYANGAVRRLIGYEPEELVGTYVLSYIHPDDRDRVRRQLRTVVDEDVEPSGIEYRYRAKDGSWVWFESRMADRSNSMIDGYVVSSRDITDRKEAEFARRQTEIRLEEIAANTSESLWMFTADWSEVLFVNDAFEQLWGIPVERLEDDATAFVDGVHPEDRGRVLEAMARLSAGDRIDLEYRVNETTGYRRWVWVRGAPVTEDGEVERVTGFARDITDRRRRERQLQVMDRLLRHNLRNELNIVIGRAELAGELGSADVREHTDAIERVCRSILTTAEKEREIVNLLSNGGGRSAFDLIAAVQDAVATVSRTYPSAEITLDAPEDVCALGVPGFDLAAAELVENAVVHARADRPSVELTVTLSDDVVEFVVVDEAPPIPREDVNVLLGEPRDDALSHGSGLGLWLVHWTVELSNGSISLTRLEGGNGIRVTLQRANTT